jgi:hypothetical protein
MKKVFIYHDDSGRVRMISVGKLKTAGNLILFEKNVNDEEEQSLKIGPGIKVVKDKKLEKFNLEK